MARVSGHTRVVNGRRVAVRSHRRALRPARAWRNAKRANRHRKQRAYTTAVVFGSIAAAELGAWVLFRTTGVVLLGAALLLAGLGELLGRYTR